MLHRSTLGPCTAVSFHPPSLICPHTSPRHNCIPQEIQYKGQTEVEVIHVSPYFLESIILRLIVSTVTYPGPSLTGEAVPIPHVSLPPPHSLVAAI